jgi:hypothetical protein
VWVAARVVMEPGVDLSVTGKLTPKPLTPKRLPEEGSRFGGEIPLLGDGSCGDGLELVC